MPGAWHRAGPRKPRWSHTPSASLLSQLWLCSVRPPQHPGNLKDGPAGGKAGPEHL